MFIPYTNTELSLRKVLQVIIPTPNQFLASFLLTVVFLIYAFNASIQSFLFSLVGISSVEFNRSWADLLANLSSVPYAEKIILVLFWAGIGLVFYLIYLKIVNAFAGSANDLLMQSSYINKPSFNQRLSSRVARTGGALVIAAVLAVLSNLAISALLPLVSGVNNYTLAAAAGGLIGVLGLWAYAYFLILGFAAIFYLLEVS
ncbi:MAG TPA: hypothetical protein VLF21_01565 [Candidatus Saccharimonadales bacterium]|nr:hypothetical protein [Candidatus Saccharimonadales bacterium]